jgi:hypothetical protein
MKRLILEGVLAVLLMSGSAAATCTYQGATYSEGARICMYRTMFMCRGKRWVKTAERCWEKYSTQAGPLPYAGQRLPGVPAQANTNVTVCDAMAVGEDR